LLSIRLSAPWLDRARLAAAALGYVAIAVLSSVPGVRPHVPGLSDKLEHVFAFFVLGAVTVLAVRGFSGRRFLAIFVVYAAVLEIAQIFIPGREASLLDLAASLAGALLGVTIALLFRSPLMSR
jgi:VanZ family protein